jgi:hypothetical protein
VQLNTILVVASDQLGGDGRTMLGATSAGIVLVQVVRQCVPSASDANHDVRSQNLLIESETFPLVLDDDVKKNRFVLKKVLCLIMAERFNFVVSLHPRNLSACF